MDKGRNTLKSDCTDIFDSGIVSLYYKSITMKQKIFFQILLFEMMVPGMTRASTGSASDGFWFIMVFLLIFAGIVGFLAGVDYLKRNGRRLLRSGYHLVLRWRETIFSRLHIRSFKHTRVRPVEDLFYSA
jgi:hypothetical protein